MNHNTVYKYKVDSELYDITKTEDGYINIYKNQLKHRSVNDINMANVVGYNGIDMDTIEFRYNEYFTHGSDLDLSDLKLTHIPEPLFQKRFANIKMLFICDNKISGKIDLRHLHHLTVFDCSFNKLEILPLLPINIEEVNCKHNQIVSIDELKHTRLLRIDASFNKITHIPAIKTLISCTCENNEITTVETMPNLLSLDCRNNKLIEIPFFEKLTKLECDNNMIKYITSMPQLEHLYCTNNNLTSLADFKSLIHINFVDTWIEELPYYPELNECICTCDRLKRLSDQYKITYTVSANNILSIVFHK